MFEILFTIFHVLICLLLVVTVLLQAGKGGGLAGSIGGGLASSSVLGGRTAATFLTKATTILATAFMLSCLVQSVAFQTAETTPTTATQRTMAEEQVPAAVPISRRQSTCWARRKSRLRPEPLRSHRPKLSSRPA